MGSKKQKHSFLNSLLTLILFLGLAGLGFWFYKSQIKETLKENPLPTLQEIEKKIIAPEPLISPKRETRADKLNPDLIFRWTNYYREKNNAAELSRNASLDNAATAKVNDMFQKQYFEHVGPDGKNASFWVEEAGYKYIVIGENLALGDYKDEKELVDAWMASPGHRKNILRPQFTEIGIAAKLGGFQDRQTFLAAQLFGTPASLCKAPDQPLKDEIKDKKDQYEALKETAEKVKKLIKESNELMKEGNAKIKEGNQADTREEAEGLWTEGEALQEEAKEKYEEAQKLQEGLADAGKLYEEIKTLTDKYNQQIKDYNACLQKYQ